MNTKVNIIFNNTFKIVLSLFFISIFMTNCEKDESIVQEPNGKQKLFKVSFDDFKYKVNDNKELQKIVALADVNMAKNNTDAKIDSTSQITILTDEIKMIVLDSISTYTFEVSTNDEIENNEFYNLVIFVNNNTQDIYQSYFLEYSPSNIWLTDTSQQYTGGLSLINNDFFDATNLFESKSGDECVIGANVHWECNNGNEHSPSVGPPTCVADTFTYWITAETGSCLESGSYTLPPGGGSTGSTPGGGAPGNDDGIDDDEGGTKLSTSPIGGGSRDNSNNDDCTADSELINRVFGLSDVTLRTEIMIYLNSNGNSCEAREFIDAGLDAVDDGGELDIENEIIFSNAFKQTRAYCVVKLLTDTNNNLFKDVISTFTGDNAKSGIRFLYEPLYLPNGGNDLNTEANTSPPDPLGITTIRFNSFTNSAFDNSLKIATNILHESIHANLYRIVTGNNIVPNPLPANQYQYIVNLLDYYENNNSSMFITSNAHHTFMANFHVGKIASAIKELDNNSYNLDHYMKFGWEGLSQIGTASQPQLVTNAELSNFESLALIPLNDNNNLSCDD